ncbi:MAG: hypothetical protein AAF664_18265, partial [Planctomycetota bacterium]
FDESEPNDWSKPWWVVSETTFLDKDFIDYVRKLERPVCIASVSDEGRVVVWDASALGCEETQRFDLRDASKSEESSAVRTGDLPSFVCQEKSPLRWAMTSEPIWMDSRVSTLDSSKVMIWALLPDLRLLCFESHAAGGRQVCDRLPSSQVIAHRLDDHGVILVLRDSEKLAWVVRVRLDDSLVRMDRVEEESDVIGYEITDDYLIQMCRKSYRWSPRIDVASELSWQTVGQPSRFIGEGVFAVDDELRVFDPQAELHGRLLFKLPIQGIERFSLAVRSLTEPNHHNSEYGTLCLVSDSARFVVVPTDSGFIKHEIERVIRGHHAPALPSGDEFQRESPSLIASDRSNQVLFLQWGKAIRDLQTRGQQKHKYVRLDLGQRTIRTTNDHPKNAFESLEPSLRRKLPRRETRKRVSSVNVLGGVVYFEKRAGETLEIIPNAQQILKIRPSETRQPMVSFDAPKVVKSGHFEGDRSLVAPTATRWTLREATLDGGWAWLDSRGLLHLKHRGSVEELTLVLDSKHVSGWFSASGAFGLALYRGKKGSTGDSIVPEAVLRWLANWGQVS